MQNVLPALPLAISTGLIVGLAVAGVVVLWVVFTYNGLVSAREQVRMAWSQIDVLLKRRHDLIPNLVNTVKGYATHEQNTLSAVIAARNAAVAARSPGEQIAAEGQLTTAVRQLFAVAEAYPQLKADTSFLKLQDELTDTENRISGQRQGYNQTVQVYNTKVMSIPTNFIAGPFGFTTQPFFEIQDPTQREAPQVKF
jgi:LemA protein